MPIPEFTSEEKYLIDFARGHLAAGQSNSYMWSYLFGACLLAGFGIYSQNVLMLGAAFVVVCGFRIYENSYGNRWQPHWKSIFDKYDAACSQEAPGAPEGKT